MVILKPLLRPLEWPEPLPAVQPNPPQLRTPPDDVVLFEVEALTLEKLHKPVFVVAET